jgi:hypothetical protein
MQLRATGIWCVASAFGASHPRVHDQRVHASSKLVTRVHTLCAARELR